MADEPDNVVLRRLAEIRATQEQQGERLGRIEARLGGIEGRFDDLEREMAYALGLNTRSIVKHKEQDARISELVTKVEELLSRP